MRTSTPRRRRPAQPARPSDVESTPSGQNQSEGGGDKNGLMDEVPVVVDRQRSDGKQQCGDQARHEAEHFDGRAKEQNGDSSGHDRRQAQFRFGEVGKCLCALHSGQRKSECGQRRAVAVLRIVGEGFSSQQLSDDVRVDGFIGVHGPRTQLRQAKGKPEKRDKKKSSPANPLPTREARCVSGDPFRSSMGSISGRLAPHFDLNVVVQFVGRVAVAVEANIAAFRALGIDQLALVGLDVIQVLAGAGAKFVLKSLLKMVVTPDLNVGSSETWATTSR